MSNLHKQEDNKIDVLKFPDNIRSVSGMYIGSKGDCTNILRECIDNAMDELSFVPDFNTIIIETGENGSWFMVSDKGRGMPIYMHEHYPGMTAARVATSVINAGGKFNKSKVSAGQNGTGIKTTNALSDRFVMMVKLTPENVVNTMDIIKDNAEEILKQDSYYFIEYKKGIFIREGYKTIEELSSKYGINIPKGSSTVVFFEPDYELIKNRTYELPIYNFRYKAFQMHEYLHKDISILVNGVEQVSELPQYKHKVKHTFRNLRNAKSNESIDLFFSFEISSDLRSKTYKGSVNSLVVNDGVHIRMAVDAIRKAISNLTGCENTYKLEQGIKVRSILSAVKVDFKSQTKEYCNVVDGWVPEMYNELVPKVEEILKKDLKFIKDYVSRIRELDVTYKKLADKRYIDQHIKVSGESKKLQTPSKGLIEAGSKSTDRDKCELFICEGLSAKGTLEKARDPFIHAILGLRGRPLNAAIRSVKDVVKNPEMRAIINTIGMGVVGGTVDVKNKRYGKIIIAADADPDGGLIESSVLVMMAVHMPFLLNLKMVYVAESPLYQYKDGTYVYPSDLEDKNFKLDKTKIETRFKGLGELDADQAKDIFFNKDKRRLIRITPEGSKKAIRFLEKSAEVRRQVAYEQGSLVKNLEEDEQDS